MSDKHHEISTLTDNELLLELHQTAWLLESAKSLPTLGLTPDPAIYSAIKTRHAALEAEHARRNGSADAATVGALSRTVRPAARELSMTTPARPGKISIKAEGKGAKPKRVDIYLTGELEAK